MCPVPIISGSHICAITEVESQVRYVSEIWLLSFSILPLRTKPVASFLNMILILRQYKQHATEFSRPYIVTGKHASSLTFILSDVRPSPFICRFLSHVTVGFGSPITTQCSITDCPSGTVIFLGFTLNCGFTVKVNQDNIVERDRGNACLQI